MAGLLISGPAGGGKSEHARQVLEANPGPAVIADFQAIYAGLLLQERTAGGRYPERMPEHEYLLPLAEYTRRVIVRAGVERDLYVITTNSDGDLDRRRELLGLLGSGARETVIDPGIEVVRARLAVGGELSEQCRDAINRWYGRRNG